ncbi:arsenate reductase (glutaredoxin) [Oscillatoria amoena NRMC-F 0135]|nr:arsenate reductase (glutaredoxin) [Oscillatoria laete-virens]MDL5048665.1 arsenate reductase (glutaredoxin) [Oscillatoria amoena NRMC-F 0135]MDL5053242.1 arsenate reductase (glutaredoxin) [Oscillatoria laete-virens NRMC-F 0139]
MQKVILYHNPRCSKSRQALELLRQAGVDIEIREYLKTPPDLGEIESLSKLLGVPPREMVRDSEDEFAGLENADAGKLLRAIVKSPILLQRPIAVHGKKAVIARPPERVSEILN